MTKPYYTLLMRDGFGRWHPQFGDFNRDIVEDERNDSYDDVPRQRMKIIKTEDARQATVDAAVAALNEKEGARV